LKNLKTKTFQMKRKPQARYTEQMKLKIMIVIVMMGTWEPIGRSGWKWVATPPQSHKSQTWRQWRRQ